MEMMRNVLAAYDLHKNDCTLEVINNGLINTTYIARCGAGDYILQKVNTNVFKEPEMLADNLHRLGTYLKERDIHYNFIGPVERNGHSIAVVDGEYWRIFHYVPESVTINRVENNKQAYEAARQFALFTNAFADFKAEALYETIPDFHNLQLRYLQFSKALQNGNKQRLQHAQEFIKQAHAYKNIVDSYVRIVEHNLLPKRVIHHDTKISNVLFNSEDQGLCVIDLDTVMAGYIISDLGDMMRTYLSEATEESRNAEAMAIRPEIFTAILQGYTDGLGNNMTENEWDYFTYSGRFIIYMQAIRFLADYLNGDIYYKVSYDKHNLNRAATQFKLLQEYISMEPDLKYAVEERKAAFYSR